MSAWISKFLLAWRLGKIKIADFVSYSLSASFTPFSGLGQILYEIRDVKISTLCNTQARYVHLNKGDPYISIRFSVIIHFGSQNQNG